MLTYRITGKVSDQGEITLNSAELKILSLIDGQRSIKQIILDGGFDEYSAYKILYSLLSSGLIEAIETQPEHAAGEPIEESKNYSTITAAYNNILQVLFRSLEDEIGNQAFVIFDESERVAASQPYDIFRNFQPKSAVHVNAREISQEIAPIEDYEDACQ